MAKTLGGAEYYHRVSARDRPQPKSQVFNSGTVPKARLSLFPGSKLILGSRGGLKRS